MICKNKKTLILTSLLTLLPMAVGLLLWNRLPSHMATHWGPGGQADGWTGRMVAVICLPLIMLAVHWLCVLFANLDKSNRGKNEKMQKLVLWTIPLLSNFCLGMMYAIALGSDISIMNLMLVFMGILFAAMGNYMPKCKMNATIGIKIRWTYTSEENWNMTHRFAGRLWFCGGVIMALCCVLPSAVCMPVMLVILLAMVLLPILYSYRYYRMQIQRGDEMQELPVYVTKFKKGGIPVIILTVALLAVLLFTGDITVELGDASFTVNATYESALTVEYAAIDSIELREGDVSGTRVMGFGSPKLLLGTFENEEFGLYTRYTYGRNEACIVLTSGGKTLVLSGADREETLAIYEAILAKIQ